MLYACLSVCLCNCLFVFVGLLVCLGVCVCFRFVLFDLFDVYDMFWLSVCRLVPV